EQIEALTLSLQENPNDPKVLFKRGRVYLEREDLSLALADLNAALQNQPSNLEPLIYRGLVLHKSGRDAEALADLNRYMAHGPLDYFAFEVRSQIRASLKEIEGAIEDLNQAITLRPKPEHFVDRAKLFLEQGRTEDAIANYEEGIKVLGEPVALVLELVTLEVKANRFHDALRRIEKLERAAKRRERWILYRADLLRQVGQLTEAHQAYMDALQLIEQRLTLAKPAPLLLLQKAHALWGVGRQDDAIVLFSSLDESVRKLKEYQRLSTLLAAR
ncbi:MAG: tetratricopeptide repeat protein, partial [Candidatus Omnitrophica bacterium]|nr:tetratricopeptide repeat protein [Candidatus Omnitrophota bacterium]